MKASGAGRSAQASIMAAEANHGENYWDGVGEVMVKESPETMRGSVEGRCEVVHSDSGCMNELSIYVPLDVVGSDESKWVDGTCA